MATADKTSAEKWIKAIAQYDKEFKQWEGRTEKIVKIYRDQDSASDRSDGATLNILWSNVQTAIPAVFSRLPKPDVSRRFRDTDPVGRVASLILERALEYEIDRYGDYRASMKNCVQDRFLGGRGMAWVRYDPHFKAADDGAQITEDVENEGDEYEEPAEVIDYECAPVDYVHWKDFGHTIARTWEEITAVWRKVYMDRDSLNERFGEDIGKKIPLDTKPDDLKKTVGGGSAEMYQALIYEIWDKPSGKALWLSKSLGEIVDERDDPLELDGFYPCPKPLFSTITTDSLIPVPDYKLYQDQAKELNIISDRIDGLVKALKVRGVYDASEPTLARLFTEGENNTLLPVKNWAAFSEKQGLKGAIDLIDIQPFAMALAECYKASKAIKEEIYEITGLADIIRGSTDPNETLGAQKMKGQFGSMRLRDMQGAVVQFATELLQIKAQIMCKHYQPETLAKISGATQFNPADQQYIPQALQMLKDNTLSGFRIEVSSDSMVQIDEMQEKSDRVEFLKATGSFLKEALPVAQSTPEIAPLLVEMLKFGVTAFKVGKSLEGLFDEILDKLRDAAAQPKPPPPPNPDMMKIQAQSQAKAQEMQQAFQLDQQRANLDAQLESHKQEVQAQQNAHQNQLEAQRAQQQAQMDAQLEAQRIASEERAAASDQQLSIILEHIRNMGKIEVAEIAAATTLQAGQINAARASEVE